MRAKLIVFGAASLALFALGVWGGAKSRPVSTPDQGTDRPERESARAVGKDDSPKTSTPLAPIEFETAHQSFAAARAEPNLFQRQLSMTSILSSAGRAECRHLLEDCDPEDEMAMRAISVRWAELDPEGMFRYLLGDGWQLRKNIAVYGELFATWTAIDADTAWHRAAETAPDLRDNFQRQIFGNLLSSDPERAMEFIANTNSIGFGLEGQFADWSDADPDRSAELLLNLPRGNFKNSASGVLAERWGKQNPAAAFEFAERIEEELIRERAREKVIAGWLVNDFEAARERVESLQGGAKARLGKRLAGNLAERDPDAAVDWAKQHLEGGARADAIDHVVRRASAAHPAQAAKIAAEMPAGYRKEAAITAAVRAWKEKDPRAARGWVDGLESGFARRAAAAGLK